MKIVIVNQKSGHSRTLTMNRAILGITVAGILSIPAAMGMVSYRYGVAEAGMASELVSRWKEVLRQQGEDVKEAERSAKEELEAAALRLAQLQARIVRLDALGERLTGIAKLDKGEFDFSQPPAMGGPESADIGSAYRAPEYLELLGRLAKDIENRELQLSVLETLLVDRKIQGDVFLAGRPIKKGWMSSRFGRRNDPITGRLAWHNGVDFAAKEGSDVNTVAAGVVVYAGERSGYGKMVEVNHGKGFSTRYGHHKKLLVKVGDIVKKGQVVGIMGSSGRSTGPHVHFEVFKNGRVVDPSAYIHRASR